MTKMTKRMMDIYKGIYQAPQPKQHLAKKYNVTVKTIENTILKYSNNFPNDIVYDTRLTAYRFKNLLPKYIPYNIFYNLFQNSITNKIIKNDFLIASKIIEHEIDEKSIMIKTGSLSSLAQKIIQCTIAINNSCVIQVSYKGHNKDMEEKYIIPRKISSSGFVYYLYAEYEKRNNKNIGEGRSFSLSAVSTIAPVEYIKDSHFEISSTTNAFGVINKSQLVLLKLESNAASFFKREGLLQEDNYDFVSEETDGSIVIKMYYSNLNEVVSLIQRWMPLIAIQDSPSITKEIYDKISENYNLLFRSLST